jgi:polysaccharide biosynthesis/export protein
MRQGRLNKVCIVVSLGLIAALGAGCAKRQATYVAVDPNTGQQYQVVQQAQQQQQQVATTYQQPVQYQSRGFELYGQGGVSAQAQAAPSSAPATTTDDIPNRGLFTSRRSVAPAPQAQQSYVVQYQAPALAAAPAQTYVMQQPATVVQQPATVVQAPARAVVAPAPGSRGIYATPGRAYASTAPYVAAGPSYTLDSGDKLRVTVFGQEGLTNSYTIDAGGNINMPLIGAQPARGLTTQQLAGLITQRLKHGFVRDPSVSVEVELYRPFFILGEVTTPGQYPYVANLTVEGAVAIAGGFSPRANKRTAELTRSTGAQQFRSEVPLTTPIKPGDTIVVKERWF